MKDTVCMAAGHPVTGPERFSDEASHVTDSEWNVTDSNEMGFLTDKEYQNSMADLQQLLVSVSDFSHEECAKILTALAKGKSLKERNQSKGSTANGTSSIFNDVDAKQIYRLSKIIENFTAESEKICSKPSTSLKSAFQHQANKFLTRFHNQRRDELSVILENECWRPAEIRGELQRFIDDISQNEPFDAVDGYLVINDEKYVVVG